MLAHLLPILPECLHPGAYVMSAETAGGQISVMAQVREGNMDSTTRMNLGDFDD